MTSFTAAATFGGRLATISLKRSSSFVTPATSKAHCTCSSQSSGSSGTKGGIRNVVKCCTAAGWAPVNGAAGAAAWVAAADAAAWLTAGAVGWATAGAAAWLAAGAVSGETAGAAAWLAAGAVGGTTAGAALRSATD